MSDDRERSVWPWIAAVVIWLPMLYALSFGPVFWLVEFEFAPKRPVAFIYIRTLESASAPG